METLLPRAGKWGGDLTLSGRKRGGSRGTLLVDQKAKGKGRKHKGEKSLIKKRSETKGVN